MVGPVQTVYGTGIIDQQAAESHNLAQDQLAIQTQRAADAQNLRMYYLDAQRNGIQAAQLAYQQRAEQIRAQMQARSDAYSQRQGAASLKTQIANSLAARSGPQDWVKYANLKDQLLPPTPTSSQTVDPYSWLDNLVDPNYRDGANVDLSGLTNAPPGLSTPPSLLQPSTFGQPPAAPAPPGQGLGAGPGNPGYRPPPAMGPGSSVTQPGSSGVGFNPAGSQLTGPQWSGVRDQDVSYLDAPGKSAFVTTGTGGASKASDYWHGSSYDAPDAGYAGPRYKVSVGGQEITDPNRQIGAGTPVWLTRFAQGGMSGGQMGGSMMVGDAGGQNPSAGGARPEIVINPTHAPLMVLNHQQTQKAMKGKKKAKPKRMASGGTYNFGDPNTYTYNTYSPADMGNQPWIKQLMQGGQQQEFGGFGASLSNPAFGVQNAPWGINLQQYLKADPSSQDMTKGLYEDALGVDFRDVLNQANAAAPFGRTPHAATYGA